MVGSGPGEAHVFLDTHSERFHSYERANPGHGLVKTGMVTSGSGPCIFSRTQLVFVSTCQARKMQAGQGRAENL